MNLVLISTLSDHCKNGPICDYEITVSSSNMNILNALL